MAVKLAANVGSWFFGSIAIYHQNIALYGAVFALNITLGIVIWLFHTFGNEQVS